MDGMSSQEWADRWADAVASLLVICFSSNTWPKTVEGWAAATTPCSVMVLQAAWDRARRDYASAYEFSQGKE